MTFKEENSNECRCINQRIQLKNGTELQKTEFKPMIDMIRSIFMHAPFTSKMVPQEISPQTSDEAANARLPNNLRATIHQLSWEIICKSACGNGAEEATFALLDSQVLQVYSWEAKVVLILAAFAMTYGQFWVNASSSSPDDLTRSVCWFLQPSCFLQTTNTKSLILRYKSLHNLIEKMLEVADGMVELKEVTTNNKIQFDVSIKNTIRTGVYGIFASVYTCLSYNMNFVKMDAEYPLSDTEICVINDYYHKLNEVHAHLSRSCTQEKEYLYIQSLFNDKKNRSVEELISEFYNLQDKLTQCLGHNSGKGDFKVLNSKRVWFIISHMDFSEIEYSSLKTAYQTRTEEDFNVVWIPMVDQSIKWNDKHEERIMGIGAASMPWYWLCELSSIKLAFLRYIRQKWYFQRKPILVTLGENCQVTNIDAFPIVEFCGLDAFPYFKDEDEDLLLKIYNNKPLRYMLRKLHSNLQESAEEVKVVCFYGGHDYIWLKDFLIQMKSIMEHLTEKSLIKVPTGKSFCMEIVYIGTDRPEEKLKKLTENITALIKSMNLDPHGKLKLCSWEHQQIKRFWSHLTYLCYERKKDDNVVPLNDPIMKDLMTLSALDHHEDGWAIMYEESKDVIFNGGKPLMECLNELNLWSSDIQGSAGFITALEPHLNNNTMHCTKAEVPATPTNADLMKICWVCGKPMDKSFIFKCCQE